MPTAILPPRPSSLKSSGQLVSIGEAARLAGVDPQTIRRDMASGLIEGITTPGGHRRLNIRSVAEAFGIADAMEDDGKENGLGAGRVVLAYARVSTSKQRADGNLARQEERLRAYCAENYPGQVVKVIAEVGSGLSDQRQGFLRLVEMLSAGRVAVLVCEFRDRIARFGVGVVQRLCEAHGTEFVESRTGDEVEHAQTAEQEMAKDVLAILAVYSNRAMGKRGADKTRLVVPAGFRERVAVLYGQGLGRNQVIAAIVAEGWKCANTGRPLGESSVRSVLRDFRQTAIPQVLKTFIRDVCVCSAGRHAMTAAVWLAFRKYAAGKKVDVNQLTRAKFWSLVKGAAGGIYIEKSMGEKRVCGLGLKGQPA